MATEEVAMAYPPGAVECAMKAHEVIMRALDGQLTWIQAAEILGRSPRSIRRLRWRLQHRGYDGLFDRRRRTPSPKRAPVAEVQRLLALYRDRYQGFNVRHFHQLARRQHGVRFCYAFVKKALQSAGLVPKHRPRGRHRRRREPRPCFGELLHLDGSRHRWLALVPAQWYTLIAVVDDATKRLLYAQLGEGGESVAAIMTALRAVLEHEGVPMALYTDRAHWAVHTPVAGGGPDRRRPTQVGRALARLGIEHILGYSPAARGRSERVNRTLQDRLVNELRVAGITTVAAANRYLRERFIPAFNIEFARPPADPASAFVALGRVDLDQILCVEEERVVGRDNVVVIAGLALQVAKQPGRRSCAGLRVLVRRHLDGQYSIWYGARCLGRYDRHGRARQAA
jgi:transposase